MKYLSKLFFLLMIVLSIFPILSIHAQDGGKFDLGADIYSRYVWRGTDFGNSPAIQPEMSYSNSGFTIGAWGSYSTNSNNMEETDLFISYDIKELVSLTISDYFFPNGTSSNNNYIDYSKDSTGHVYEGTASFNGTKKVPISLAVSYNFYGADSGNSMYFELGYSGSLKTIDFNVFLGGGTGAYYLYGKNDDNFGIVNLGLNLSKEIQITDKFSLPVHASLITNPTAESVFIVFGISF